MSIERTVSERSGGESMTVFAQMRGRWCKGELEGFDSESSVRSMDFVIYDS